MLASVVLLSRMPFLFAGYGAEEDSWGLVQSTFAKHETGQYISSRFPGHPFEEDIYYLLYDASPFVYNFFSALFSAAAAVLFFLILKEHKIKSSFLSALAFAFVPVIYISGTCTIDYDWALAFILASYLCLLRSKVLFAGLCLGLATSTRLSSLAMLLPFFLHLLSWKRRVLSLKQWLLLAAAAITVTVVLYIPVIGHYGSGFLTFTDYFPRPAFPKMVFKGTLAVWGTLGMIALLIGITNVFMQRKAIVPDRPEIVWLAAVLVFLVGYILLPLKPGYMVPLVPFVLFFLFQHMNHGASRLFSWLMIISPFIFGIDLADRNRGSDASAASTVFRVSGTDVNFDLFYGPVLNDHSKRVRKEKFADSALGRIRRLQGKNLVICGWWLNDLVVRSGKDVFSGNITMEYYSDEAALMRYKNNGYTIWYLPEQDLWNDTRYRMNATRNFSQPLFPDEP